MNISIRYLLGVVAGLILGALVPAAGGDALQVAAGLMAIIVRVARVLTVPLVFFAMVIAADELADSGVTLWTTVRSLLLTAATVVVSVVVGALAILGLSPQRIPPMVQEGSIGTIPSLLDVIGSGLPANGFRLLVMDDAALGGLLLLALLIGRSLRADREITSPISLVADSANRILYRINALLVDWLGVLLIVPAVVVALEVRGVADFAVYGQLLLVVAVAAAVVGGVIYPVVLLLIDRERATPVVWLRSMAAPSLAAVSMGDSYAALGTSLRVFKENLGIPRRIGGSVAPFVAILARGGTALTALAGFLLVIRSYTALEIGFAEVVRLSGAAIAFSALMGRHPGDGVPVMLSWLAILYGRGMEESWLILLPVMPLLVRIAAWLDAISVGFITHAISVIGHHRRAADRPI